MKILMSHNAYLQRGGEDAAVDAEIALLRNRGHDVMVYRRNNLEIKSMSKAATGLSTVWSQRTAADMGRLCDYFHPHVIHSHNTFPLISPSIYWLASRRRVPVIQTLHNFRLLCPQAMFLREGKVCEDCLGKVPWRSVTRKCYQESALRSAAAATMLATHRALGTYRNRVTAYIALNNFCRDKFIAGGLPAERIRIKPNFVVTSRKPDWRDRSGALCVGRLAAEKGLDLLIEATDGIRDAPESPVRVVGAGPLAPRVQQAFGRDYLGYQAPREVFGLLHESLFLIAPSTCYETFGMAAVEAFSCGAAVIASGHGGLAELVEDGVTGLLFRPGDAADLARKIAWAFAHPEQMLKMGQAAYAEYMNKYTPEKNYTTLLSIYRDALSSAEEEVHAA